MCWIELRFGSFTIYVYKYLRGCLASWKDAVFAGADRWGVCVCFLTRRQDQLDDPGLVTSPLRAMFSTAIMAPIFHKWELG